MLTLIILMVLVIVIGLVLIITVQAKENKKLMDLYITLELYNLKLKLALNEAGYIENRSDADGN